mgnify:FL=1
MNDCFDATVEFIRTIGKDRGVTVIKVLKNRRNHYHYFMLSAFIGTPPRIKSVNIRDLSVGPITFLCTLEKPNYTVCKTQYIVA